MKHENNKKTLIKANLLLLCLAAAALLQPHALAAEDTEYLVPAGFTVGISLEADGVIVTGVSAFDRGPSPAEEAGIRPGDIITSLGDTPVRCADDVKTALEACRGEMEAKVVRGGRTVSLTVRPRSGEDGEPVLGLRLRDSLAGIGTVTFYDPETGAFGALGHAVNDVDTGVCVPLRSGSLFRSSVSDVIRGSCGSPGQLVGVFEPGQALGTLSKNTVCGIFGQMRECPPCGSEALPAASDSEIKTGPAVILSNITGTVISEYDVEITRVSTGGGDARCMMIKVTDPDLIEDAGGIVQGMSGSPIIQNGKLVGAVTHVLVNDPTRGYAVSISRMLEAAELVAEKAA